MSNMRKKNSEEEWENRELGASESYVRKVSVSREEIVEKKLRLQAISIRLQKSLINDLIELARDDGLGYQPYIRQILTQHVKNQKKRLRAIK